MPDGPGLPDWPIPHLLAVALAAAIAIALLSAGATSTAAFGAYNPTWDGTSEFQSLPETVGADSEVVQDAAAYDNVTGGGSDSEGSTAGDAPASGTLAVVLSPDGPYEDTGPLRRFVERGGTLLVAEDVGSTGNSILDAVGASARVDGRLVRDDRHHGPSPAFPAVPNVTSHPFTTGVGALELNHGTAVAPGNATVLATTSPFAYLDTTPNGELDGNETLGAEPVATVEPVGEGRVVVVGDPSLFVNAMADARDNRAFARGLVAAHDRVLFDAVNTGGVPAVVGAQLALRGTPWLQFAVGVAAVLAIVAVPQVAGLVRRRSDRPGGADLAPLTDTDRDAVADVLADRYPDWEADRVARVTDTIMSRQPESRTNDRSE